jgi:hypothetical protein
MSFSTMQTVQVHGHKIVTWNNEIRFCGGDRIRERLQRRQATVDMDLPHSPRLPKWMVRGAESLNVASRISQRHRESRGREPATGGGN